MTTEELTMLLARIQLLDNRAIDELTIQAWEPIVGDLHIEDAIEAVNEHFRASDAYLRPTHVVQGAARARIARWAAARRTPHEARYETVRGIEVCWICGTRPHEHGIDGCAHQFDAASGYCTRCGVREDQARAPREPVYVEGW